MLSSVFLLWSVLVPCAWAATPPCTVAHSGNLSPNGVPGAFGLFRNVLAFDPTNLENTFDVSLQACLSQPTGGTATGTLLSPTGECLAVINATATQGPTVAAADCSTAGARSDMTWASHNGFIYWAGPTSSDCATGLYGYQAVSSSGNPAAVQKGPVSLGCSSESGVFGFSVL